MGKCRANFTQQWLWDKGASWESNVILDEHNWFRKKKLRRGQAGGIVIGRGKI